MSEFTVPTAMNAMVLKEYMGSYDTFNPSAMGLSTMSIPKPKNNQVLVQVKASSVNPVDWKFCSGALHGWMPALFPHIPGFDVSGVVVDIGSECNRLKIGDHVWGDIVTRVGEGEMHEGGGRWGKDDPSQTPMIMGGYGEFVAVDEKRLSLKPSNLSFDQAGVFPLAALTSYQALNECNVSSDSTILILGGSTANGICAIQLAKALGAKTIYATCSIRNEEFVQNLGAEVINYTNSDWGTILKGKNVDAIFDCVGPKSEPECLRKASEVLNPNGHFATLLLHKNGSLPQGMHNHFVLTKSDDAAQLDKLKEYVEAGQLSMPLYETFALVDVPKAFELSQSGKPVGKICIHVSD